MIIPMNRPSIGNAELKLVAEVFRSGWLGEGSYTELFEKAIAAFTAAPCVVAVNTGTSALHLALHAFGIGRGDEVILPSMTFVSDPQAVLMCGAKPVFCDIDRRTLNASAQTVAPLITKRTRAIMPTDFAGLPCNVRAIRRVVGDRDIKIIRDASHSFGSTLEGKAVGVFAGEDATCFSFDPIKNATCGEGGAILLKDRDTAARLRSQKMLGIVRGSWYSFSKKKVEDRRVIQQGFRYHMSNINAAIGLVQMKRFKTLAKKKQLLARRYDELFTPNRKIRLFKRAYDDIVPFMYIIRVPAGERDSLIAYLIDNGIYAGLRYFPCHLQPYFSTPARRALPVTEQLAREMVSIPLYTDLTMKQAERIASAVNRYCKAG